MFITRGNSMPDFERKTWLDTHVVPLLHQQPPAALHTVFWNGSPPKEVLVFLLATHPDTWPRLVQRLLEAGFVFDFLRDVQPVVHEGQRLVLFGGDGTPLFDKNGHASVRLFRKLEDGTAFIIQIGYRYESGIDAAMVVKTFFAQWNDKTPFDVCAAYSAPFGQA